MSFLMKHNTKMRGLLAKQLSLPLMVFVSVGVASALFVMVFVAPTKHDTRETRVDKLLRDIDLDPDPLHNDFTPAVVELSKCDISILPQVLPLFRSDHRLTAARAE